MKLGKFELTVVRDGTFWLDGGAMFGVVPKILWNKLCPSDEVNRIKLALNCLLVRTPETTILIDTGIGTGLKERLREIYRVKKDKGLIEELATIGVVPEDVDFVINTHLHFDHCGGNTILKEGKAVPAFPRARYVIQEEEWYDATHPNERTKASYLADNFVPLESSGQLMRVDGKHEVTSGVSVFVTNGHTRGHQSVMIESEGKTALYLGDFIPTTSHIKLPYVMGYDLYPLALIDTKKGLLHRAVEEHWLLVFEHDPKISWAYLLEDNGQQVLKPVA
jgi:glyoxylase-like metal-dependent hydrolase (beta-lactamase superfamily II)